MAEQSDNLTELLARLARGEMDEARIRSPEPSCRLRHRSREGMEGQVWCLVGKLALAPIQCLSQAVKAIQARNRDLVLRLRIVLAPCGPCGSDTDVKTIFQNRVVASTAGEDGVQPTEPFSGSPCEQSMSQGSNKE